MYELGAERAGVPATECVFVDDLEFNLKPAKELGMATVHHTSAETSIAELERLLGRKQLEVDFLKRAFEQVRGAASIPTSDGGKESIAVSKTRSRSKEKC